MTSLETWSKVDTYITKRLHPQDDVLEQVLAANRKAGLPEIDVSPNQGKLLHIWARMQRAERILEIGTLGGYSTIWLARALPEGGRLVTLELNPGFAEVACSNLALAGLDHLVEVRVGAALDQFTLLEQEQAEPFDLIFIDADKPNNPAYLQWALRFSRPGTVIIGDNVVRGGEIIEQYSTDPRVQGVRQFYDLLGQHPDITATAIQTVGSKGYDGFAIGIVNG
ncbi:Catechol O-methyltransferase [Paenibacillus solanacearum]|uniref:Catechol O-methyltransferase n=1 Tax=Paenibacillus solanacearum TaxID=2048548 RepID=A0A916KAA0_9BACL|nr:O-methyltransferase [Paenibacillus solanacearum]CAG7651285.1 Catechol O-methyltransferase [Paenibacillus solanacearum]